MNDVGRSRARADRFDSQRKHGGMIGGGIWNHGSAEIIDITITGNAARSDGGGLANAGKMDIRRSTIESNSTPSQGAGSRIAGDFAGGQLGHEQPDDILGSGSRFCGRCGRGRALDLAANHRSTVPSGFGGSAIVSRAASSRC